VEAKMSSKKQASSLALINIRAAEALASST